LIKDKQVWKAWWKAARPPFYIATLVPLILAYLAAEKFYSGPEPETSRVLVFSGAFIVCLALHLCSNLANELFDYLAGTDSGQSIGGTGALSGGLITPGQIRRVLLILYALTFILTAFGVWLTGLYWLGAIALFAAACTYFYVAPPIRYGYHAMGELFVFLNMGLLISGGVYYALTGAFSAPLLALSLPVGLMVAGILYFQSLPEIETDKAAGKKTLAGVLGPEKAIFLHLLLWPVIWLLMLTLWLGGLCAWPVLPGIVACLPLHIKTCLRLQRVASAPENEQNWLGLDKYGWLVRAMYLLCGVSLIWAVAIL
jgi:1,4-dihydroxy-2-naphthoate octaprenyltransferase